jgi:hypothetical protein
MRLKESHRKKIKINHETQFPINKILKKKIKFFLILEKNKKKDPSKLD